MQTMAPILINFSIMFLKRILLQIQDLLRYLLTIDLHLMSLEKILPNHSGNEISMGVQNHYWWAALKFIMTTNLFFQEENHTLE